MRTKITNQLVGEERMKTIIFRANEEVQDYIKLLCDEDSRNQRPSKNLSELINRIILEHRDKIHKPNGGGMKMEHEYICNECPIKNSTRWISEEKINCPKCGSENVGVIIDLVNSA